jgi:hypothetical protein
MLSRTLTMININRSCRIEEVEGNPFSLAQERDGARLLLLISEHRFETCSATSRWLSEFKYRVLNSNINKKYRFLS